VARARPRAGPRAGREPSPSCSVGGAEASPRQPDLAAAPCSRSDQRSSHERAVQAMHTCVRPPGSTLRCGRRGPRGAEVGFVRITPTVSCDQARASLRGGGIFFSFNAVAILCRLSRERPGSSAALADARQRSRTACLSHSELPVRAAGPAYVRMPRGRPQCRPRVALPPVEPTSPPSGADLFRQERRAGGRRRPLRLESRLRFERGRPRRAARMRATVSARPRKAERRLPGRDLQVQIE
jgi:hypothetical protein